MKKIFYSLFCLIYLNVVSPSCFSQNIDSAAIWVDRFDSNNVHSLLGGNWFNYTDEGNKGESFLNPSNIKDCYWVDANRNNNKVLKFSYTLQKGGFQWDPYVGVGVSLKNGTTTIPYKTIKGIAYDYKGSSHDLVYQLNTIKDYAHYKKTIPSSKEWKTMIIPLRELRQAGWGQPVPFEADKVDALNWVMTGRDKQTGELQIDNIRLITQLPIQSDDDLASETVFEAKERKLPPMVKIADWRGFKNAAYSLTFDDNLPSQLTYVLPILNQYNLKGTFYVMTNSGSWQEFTTILSNGHEIGSHTTRHSDLTELSDGDEDAEGSLQYELAFPVKTINTQLFSYKVITFAYPFGLHNPHVIQETRKRYYASRGVWPGFNRTHPQDWMNLKINTFNYLSNRTLETDLKKTDSLETKISQQLISNGGWGIFLAHDVLPFNDAVKAKNSWHPVSKESFESFVKWLKEKQDKNELWIETVGNVTRYAKERDAADIKVLNQTNTQLKLQLTDDLPNDIFNYPITLEIRVSVTWKKVVLKQGNNSETLIVKDGIIIIDVIPDTGEIEITKSE